MSDLEVCQGVEHSTKGSRTETAKMERQQAIGSVSDIPLSAHGIGLWVESV